MRMYSTWLPEHYSQSKRRLLRAPGRPTARLRLISLLARARRILS
jgi:hypothetical protein